MNTGMKVGFSSAFGAIIGGTIAWYYHHAWWAFTIGLVIGAIASYLSYDWKEVMRVLKGPVEDPKKRAQLKRLFYKGAFLSGIFIWTIAVVGYAFLFFVHIKSGKPLFDGAGLIGSLVIGLIVSLFVTSIFRGFDEEVSGRAVMMWNPIAFPFTFLSLLLWGLLILIKEIHRVERVQSGFYAVIGMCVGHLTYHTFLGVIIGAGTGFLLGWVSFRLISVRFLKPAASF